MLVYISGCCRIAYFLQNVLWCLVSQLFFKNLINNIIYAVGKKEKKKDIKGQDLLSTESIFHLEFCLFDSTDCFQLILLELNA